MKKQTKRLRPKRVQQIRFWIVYGCTAAFFALCWVLGYGFARDQKGGTWKTIHAIGKIMAAACAAVISWFVGLDAAIQAMIIMAVVDYGTGIVLAAFGKSKKTESGKLSSKVGFRGILKKALMFGVVGLGAILDMTFGDVHMVRNAFAIFFCVNDFVSICEHAKRLNVPVPPINNILGKLLDQNGIKLEDKGTKTVVSPHKESTEGNGVG